MTLAAPDELQKAMQYLQRQDAVLEPVIAEFGTPDFAPHTDYYAALVNSIIGQQLSVKAAATIKQRFMDLFDGELPTPEAILNKQHEELRAAGLSNAKVTYVRDLAEHIVDSRIHFNDIPEQTNDEILNMLTDVKGIGEWTVHMFLMFCVGRLDVLPVGDLGIRSGIRKLYGFDDLPTPAEVASVADKYSWQPYASVASWYIWQSLDNSPD